MQLAIKRCNTIAHLENDVHNVKNWIPNYKKFLNTKPIQN